MSKLDKRLYESICEVWGGIKVGSYVFLNRGISIKDLDKVTLGVPEEKVADIEKFIKFNGYEVKNCGGYYRFEKAGYVDIKLEPLNSAQLGWYSREDEILNYKMARSSIRDIEFLAKVFTYKNKQNKRRDKNGRND